MSEREPGEHLTHATALQLATIIANHWHDAGYWDVETWVEPTGHYGNPGKAVAWGVKSNLVNGLPPSKRESH